METVNSGPNLEVSFEIRRLVVSYVLTFRRNVLPQLQCRRLSRAWQPITGLGREIRAIGALSEPMGVRERSKERRALERVVFRRWSY
jgi:hypothetical protein